MLFYRSWWFVCLFFFSGKSYTIRSRSNLIFRGLAFGFFLVQFILFVERKANSSIVQQKCICHEKRERLLISNVEFNFQFSQRNKKFIYSSSFLQLGQFYQKKGQS